MEHPNEEIRITFTPREVEVLCSAMRGLTNGKTVQASTQMEAHVAPILEKLITQSAPQVNRGENSANVTVKSRKSTFLRIISLFPWPLIKIKAVYCAISKVGRETSDWEMVRKEENLGKYVDFTFVITRDDLREIM